MDAHSSDEACCGQYKHRRPHDLDGQCPQSPSFRFVSFRSLGRSPRVPGWVCNAGLLYFNDSACLYLGWAFVSVLPTSMLESWGSCLIMRLGLGSFAFAFPVFFLGSFPFTLSLSLSFSFSLPASFPLLCHTQLPFSFSFPFIFRGWSWSWSWGWGWGGGGDGGAGRGGYPSKVIL